MSPSIEFEMDFNVLVTTCKNCDLYLIFRRDLSTMTTFTLLSPACGIVNWAEIQLFPAIIFASHLKKISICKEMEKTSIVQYSLHVSPLDSGRANCKPHFLAVRCDPR